jgi:DMSO/TMAO reductase YedYZ molybdopterin-dependent catalytic subunit
MDRSQPWTCDDCRAGVGRRTFLRLGGAVSAGALIASCKNSTESFSSPAAATEPAASATTMPAERVAREMARFPEKTDLILLTDRPPQLETPLKYFTQDLTPNEAFFVRWHLADVPTKVDTKTFRLTITGHVEHELSLSLDELKEQFEPASVTAVNQCSGNSRALFEPRVPGGQWQNGAVGNAQWTGVRLKDLLAKAKPKGGAVDVSFRGLDGPVVNTTPPFAKSLAIDHASDGEVLIAYEMNNQPLPMLNGFPCRLIVPGWYGTYWVKALTQIEVLDKKFDGFWMAKAYKIAQTPNYNESPADLAKDTAPISVMTTRSLIVRPEPAEKIPANKPCDVEGVAFDGGKGIVKVELSEDDGKTWTEASLDPDGGRYSWRRFRYKWTPNGSGVKQLLSRATNAAGETQVTHQWNRSGYARDVMDPTEVTVL